VRPTIEGRSSTQERIPPGWATAAISGLVAGDGVFVDGDWVESKDQDPGGEIRLVQLADVGDGEYRDRSERFLTADKAQRLHCTFLVPGDLLIARMPDPLGRACIFPGDSKVCVTVVDVCVIRTGADSVDHRWLMYVVNSPTIRAEVAGRQSGSTRKRISRKNLASIRLPVLPVAEQRRIVAAIEKQFTRLDAGVAALKRAQARLKRYRAAVLNAAVEGGLTAEWRAANPPTEDAAALLKRILVERRARWETEPRAKGTDPAKARYEEPRGPDVAGLPELPKGWAWASVDQLLTEPLCNGISVKGSSEPPGVPALRLSAMTEGGFDYRDRRYIPLSSVAAAPLSIREGDFFVSRGNGSLRLVGRGTLAQTPPDLVVFPDTMIRLRVNDAGSLRRYIAIAWYGPSTRHQVERKARTTAGIYKISQRDIESFAVSVPPSAEQQQIVAEVERRLSVVTELESTVEANLKRAERLRQSILREAFAGRLVAQDPSDEPASVLLERGRTGRETSPSIPPRRGA